jgi:hypothetical protein
MFLRGCKDALDRHRRPQEDRLPPGGLGQAQEVHDAGNMDALAQRGGNGSFRVAHHGLLLADEAADLSCANIEPLMRHTYSQMKYLLPY